MSDAESHGPTIPREAIEALTAVLVAWADEDSTGDRYPMPPEAISEQALEAAYPLIRARVCQELAEALREDWRPACCGSAAATGAAEFVEQFGKATTDG